MSNAARSPAQESELKSIHNASVTLRTILRAYGLHIMTTMQTAYIKISEGDTPANVAQTAQNKLQFRAGNIYEASNLWLFYCLQETEVSCKH